jgi:peptidoglycan/LPS O-acetylase OafA/YrhL
VKETHYAALDGLRGVAILLVLASHVAGFDLGHPRLFFLGELGVTLFFVLSGFLITDVLCREHARTGRVSIRRFFLRRALRIFPAFYTLIAVAAALLAAGALPDLTWLNLGECALYARNVFGRGGLSLMHTWSLALEEQFYAVWPWTFALLRRRLLGVTLALVVGVAAFRSSAIALALVDGKYGGFYMRPWFRIDSPLAGCVIALWLDRAGPVRARVLSPTAILAALLALSAFVDNALSGAGQVALCALLVLSLRMAPPSEPLAALLATAPLRLVGRLSYSLYLWQQLFLCVKTPPWLGLRRFPIDLAPTVAAALASYYLVERPFLRWKERLSTAARPPATATG